MPNLSQSPFPNRNAWIGLAIFVALLHLIGLGNHGLLEPDEGRYANMAAEWTEFDEHDWKEPVLSDVGHYDKPPLIYWLTGSSFLAFGRSEFSARLPSLFGGFLTLAGVVLIAGRLHGARAAWWSVLVTATTFQFWALTHLLSPDMLLCGLVTLGTGCALQATPGKRHGWLWWIAGALFWSLGWWTKATAALVPLGALTLALLITRRWDLLARLRPVRLFLLILLLGSPWYLLMVSKHHELWDFFFHRELAGRVTGHADGRRGFPGFHFAVALGFWLPWWPVLISPARRHWQTWRSASWAEKCRSLPWEVVAALGVIAIFSLVSSKLVTYILPGLPYLAIAVGSVIARTDAVFSFRQWPARIAGIATLSLIATALVMPGIEHSLSRNSSVRLPIAKAQELDARWLICDEFWPGAEFYFGEFVWFVDVKNLMQVESTRGQVPAKHFLSKNQVEPLVNASDGPAVWLLQYRGHFQNPQKWARKLIATRPDPDSEPIQVGDFYLWRVR
ncbi:MAG: glycosyltransferase family 39 protein [Verrucomicrobiae bacterium]|nr:glycosyltransferase family 39 protein [Verrucomicrobiae bacterium]